jgi:Predicted hydrolases of HD superfamily
MNEEKIVDFLLNAYKLKEIKRRGWIKKAGINEAESVASHVFGMLFIAYLLGKKKLFGSILIHDLAEIIIGDLTPEEKDSKIRRKEIHILENLAELLPSNTSSKLKKELNLVRKSSILKEIDKLDMAIQALYYKNKGYDKEKLKEFIINADAYIKNPKLRKIIEVIKRKFLT